MLGEDTLKIGATSSGIALSAVRDRPRLRHAELEESKVRRIVVLASSRENATLSARIRDAVEFLFQQAPEYV